GARRGTRKRECARVGIVEPGVVRGASGRRPSCAGGAGAGSMRVGRACGQGGPMAQSASDCALLLNGMAGFDERDSTSLERDDEDFTRHLGQPWAAGNDAGTPPPRARIRRPHPYLPRPPPPAARAADHPPRAPCETPRHAHQAVASPTTV
ncbi:hypothetical protein DWU95_47800, partial [Burkholderia contaminans]